MSADLLAADAHVRDEVLRVLKQELTEVTVWGRQWPPELGRQAESVQHRVSSAARAFKSHALVAADRFDGCGHSNRDAFPDRDGIMPPAVLRLKVRAT